MPDSKREISDEELDNVSGAGCDDKDSSKSHIGRELSWEETENYVGSKVVVRNIQDLREFPGLLLGVEKKDVGGLSPTPYWHVKTSDGQEHSFCAGQFRCWSYID